MTTRLWGLDLVRAVAIVMVLLAHGFQACYSLGFWGVEIFFALSGYLIGGILIREIAAPGSEPWGWRDLFRFWSRRWFRTLPNYVFYFALSLFVAGEAVGHQWRYLVFVQNLYPGQIGDFFGVSWSLAIEEWFYLLFPFLLLSVARSTGASPRRGFVVASVMLVLVPITLRMLGQSGALSLGWDAGLRKVMPFRLDAIMWGVLAAYCRHRGHVSYLIAGFGVILLTMSIAAGLLPGFGQDIGLLNLMLTAVPLGFAALLPVIELCPAPRWGAAVVSWISKHSYSLYLSHALVITWVVAQPFYITAGMAGKLGFKAMQYAVVFVLSMISFAWIERPFLRLRERVAPAR